MAVTLTAAAIVGFGSGVGLRWIGALAKPTTIDVIKQNTSRNQPVAQSYRVIVGAGAYDMPVPAGPGCSKRFYDRAPGLPQLDNCLAVPQ